MVRNLFYYVLILLGHFLTGMLFVAIHPMWNGFHAILFGGIVFLILGILSIPLEQCIKHSMSKADGYTHIIVDNKVEGAYPIFSIVVLTGCFVICLFCIGIGCWLCPFIASFFTGWKILPVIISDIQELAISFSNGVFAIYIGLYCLALYSQVTGLFGITYLYGGLITTGSLVTTIFYLFDYSTYYSTHIISANWHSLLIGVVLRMYWLGWWPTIILTGIFFPLWMYLFRCNWQTIGLKIGVCNSWNPSLQLKWLSMATLPVTLSLAILINYSVYLQATCHGYNKPPAMIINTNNITMPTTIAYNYDTLLIGSPCPGSIETIPDIFLWNTGDLHPVQLDVSRKSATMPHVNSSSDDNITSHEANNDTQSLYNILKSPIDILLSTDELLNKYTQEQRPTPIFNEFGRTSFQSADNMSTYYDAVISFAARTSLSKISGRRNPSISVWRSMNSSDIGIGTCVENMLSSIYISHLPAPEGLESIQMIYNGKTLTQRPLSHSITNNRQYVAIGLPSGIVEYNCNTNRRYRLNLSGYPLNVTKVSYSEDGNWLAGIYEGTTGPQVAVWDINKQTLIWSMPLGHHEIIDIALSHENRRIALLTNKKMIAIFYFTAVQDNPRFAF